MSESSTEALLRVESLVKHFPIEASGFRRRQIGSIQAVDDVSFEIGEGETLGLVGESGSGKSTIGRIIVLLERPTAGAVYYRDRDIHALGQEEQRRLRREIQIIYQDPYSSLNPRMTVRQTIEEAWKVHPGIVEPDDYRSKTIEILEQVGLDATTLGRYPHQFSGGQRQRIGIARALALEPRLLICDEPVSALDVSVQAQVLNLLSELKERLGLAYLFIAHDLAVVRHISDRLAVMHLGKIVETGNADELYEDPVHPYTQALLSAVPRFQRQVSGQPTRIVLPGEIPSPANPPSGCRFRTRCWKTQEICGIEEPELELRGFGHLSACHFPERRSKVA